MTFEALPGSAAWVHEDARVGFEVAWFDSARFDSARFDSARFDSGPDGHRLRGCTTGLEDGEMWAVSYEIEVDGDWRTRTARVTGRTAAGDVTRTLTTDGTGTWAVDGDRDAALDGCLDVDLESSAVTNTLPVHRLALARDASASAPAVYLRALDLSVGRLEQTYRRLDRDIPGPCFAYEAPAFDFSCVLEYDAAGLPLRYPGIARRVG